MCLEAVPACGRQQGCGIAECGSVSDFLRFAEIVTKKDKPGELKEMFDRHCRGRLMMKQRRTGNA